ncbi:hypothetical protein PFISCL1PPCAC_8909, partial [Pristionchus fissidentatus]
FKWRYCNRSFDHFRVAAGTKKMDPFKITCFVGPTFEQRAFRMDDVTLLHLTRNVRQCSLGGGDYSVQAIMDVFETISASSHELEKGITFGTT